MDCREDYPCSQSQYIVLSVWRSLGKLVSSPNKSVTNPNTLTNWTYCSFTKKTKKKTIEILCSNIKKSNLQVHPTSNAPHKPSITHSTGEPGTQNFMAKKYGYPHHPNPFF